MKFGLEGIKRLLKELKNPHRAFPSIHIAGTNGKGSTSSMLASILSAAGYKTALYTSPHLVDFEERIRINGRMIPRGAVARLTTQLKRSIGRNNPTFFEATTAIAFAWFAEQEVDIAVVETGLGGRLDSTNVLNPLCSLITNIGLEHTEILGNTVAKIAFEKGGIIKPKTPCITGVDDPKALAVIRKICREQRAQLFSASPFKARVRSAGLGGTVVDFSIDKTAYPKLQLSLAGHHQLSNLAIALKAVHVLRNATSFEISHEAVYAGLSSIQERSGLLGRLSVVHENPLIVVDVAHNPDATWNLLNVWKRLKCRKPVLVFGVVKDKDYMTMARTLARLAERVIVVAARTPRSRPASDIAAVFERLNCETHAALSVEAGVNLAMNLAGAGGTVLVTGSHFVVGEALEALRRKRP